MEYSVHVRYTLSDLVLVNNSSAYPNRQQDSYFCCGWLNVWVCVQS